MRNLDREFHAMIVYLIYKHGREMWIGKIRRLLKEIQIKYFEMYDKSLFDEVRTAEYRMMWNLVDGHVLTVRKVEDDYMFSFYYDVSIKINIKTIKKVLKKKVRRLITQTIRDNQS